MISRIHHPRCLIHRAILLSDYSSHHDIKRTFLALSVDAVAHHIFICVFNGFELNLNGCKWRLRVCKTRWIRSGLMNTFGWLWMLLNFHCTNGNIRASDCWKLFKLSSFIESDRTLKFHNFRSRTIEINCVTLLIWFSFVFDNFLSVKIILNGLKVLIVRPRYTFWIRW